MSLQDEVRNTRSEIRTDEYAMSIGEWMNLYENDELDVHPEFQRFYRWSPVQKSRLIESLLLGIPIPMIFVSQREDGVWDVVDGVQRLSTIFEFAGILKDEENKVLPPLVLNGTDYLPSLNNIRWEGGEEDENVLDTALRLQLKRSKIGVSIILKESDHRSKYDLFQRLNKGGTPLTDQEVRNCIMVMEDLTFYNWVRELADDPNFKEVVALTEKATAEQYDMELVLRFVLFRRMSEESLRAIGDINDFITEKMVETARSDEFDRSTERDAFLRVFALLNNSVKDDAFRRYDSTKQRFMGAFLISGYEVVALGLGHNVGEWADPAPITELVKGIWSDAEFRQNSGGGVRASTRVPRVIALGRRLFEAKG